MELAVYVPRPNTELRDRVWAGSGVVGSEVSDTGRLRLDFEGDGELYPEFEDRVRRAAERHAWAGNGKRGYPTRACAYADRDSVLRVGSYEPDRRELTVSEPELLEEWLEHG